MERIFRAIDKYPEAIYYKIVDKSGNRKAYGSNEDPEVLKDEIQADLDLLDDGTYQVILGKGQNLSGRSATVTIDYRKGEIISTPTRPVGRFQAAVAGFTIDDLNQAKAEGREEGLKELRVMRLEDKYNLLERRFDRFEDAFNRLVKTLDESDGEKDGKFGDTALDVLEKVSAAKDLMKNFNL